MNSVGKQGFSLGQTALLWLKTMGCQGLKG